MLEPQITLTGNVAFPPKLRTVGTGVAVADFRLACTPRRQDRATGEWTDGQTLWFGVTCWKALAENAAASLGKGDRVVVSGRLALRVWTGDDGVERTTYEIEASSLGVDLTRSRVSVERSVRASAAEDVWGVAVPADGSDGVRPEAVSGPLVPERAADAPHEAAA